MRKKRMEEMRSESELLACVNPVALPEESRFLLELDGERYVRGDGHYHDKVYWLSAMRAAVAAGRRRSRIYRRRSAGAAVAAEMMRREAARSTRCRVVTAVARDFGDMEGYPFVAVSDGQGKRRVMNEGVRLASIKWNKRSRSDLS